MAVRLAAALAAIALWCLPMTAGAQSITPPPGANATDIAGMNRASELDTTCRGSSDEPTIKWSCPARDRAFAKMQAKGWCWDYSDYTVPAYQARWHDCSEARPATSPATPDAATYTTAQPDNEASGAEHLSKAMDDGKAMLWFYVIIAVAIYFLPTSVALRRKHHNAFAIFILNLLLGWSGLGWVAALVWSLTRPAQTIVVHSRP